VLTPRKYKKAMKWLGRRGGWVARPPTFRWVWSYAYVIPSPVVHRSCCQMERLLSRQWQSGCRWPKNKILAGVDWTPVRFSIKHKPNSHDPMGGGLFQFGSLLPERGQADPTRPEAHHCPRPVLGTRLRDKGRLPPNICVLESDTTYSFSVDQS
jgi:hypothetical protein